MIYEEIQPTFVMAPPTLPKIEILVFKTNIKFKKEVKEIEMILNANPNIIHWNIDRADIDKVLRIESTNLVPGEIERVINMAGYFCQELAD